MAIRITPTPGEIELDGDDIIIGEQGMTLGFEQVFDKMCKMAIERDAQKQQSDTQRKQVASFLLEGKGK